MPYSVKSEAPIRVVGERRAERRGAGFRRAFLSLCACRDCDCMRVALAPPCAMHTRSINRVRRAEARSTGGIEIL